MPYKAVCGETKEVTRSRTRGIAGHVPGRIRPDRPTTGRRGHYRGFAERMPEVFRPAAPSHPLVQRADSLFERNELRPLHGKMDLLVIKTMD